jgi:hypothetical protein
MKPRFLYRNPIFKLPLLRRYRAICLGRWIVCRDAESEISHRLRSHEMAHQRQMDRHGIPQFYAIYLCDYFLNLWRFRNHDRAYRNIRFEKEAVAEESDSFRLPGSKDRQD